MGVWPCSMVEHGRGMELYGGVAGYGGNSAEWWVRVEGWWIQIAVGYGGEQGILVGLGGEGWRHVVCCRDTMERLYSMRWWCLTEWAAAAQSHANTSHKWVCAC